MLRRNHLQTVRIAIVLLTPLSAHANHGQITSEPQTDYATVEQVKMLTKIVSIPVAREQCWEEAVTHYQPAPQNHSYTSTIVGGILGAVVGNKFGKGSGRDWATVAGTTLGASIGSDYNNRRVAQGGSNQPSIERRCRVVNENQQEERADGYLVTYNYNGRRYETRTDTHPGDRIAVRINVRPVQGY
ncbi:MAG: hypothetical protein ACI9BW_003346 [Gammaproteobacteria bacterium]|jgi:uncharacterized protein YcfJ